MEGKQGLEDFDDYQVSIIDEEMSDDIFFQEEDHYKTAQVNHLRMYISQNVSPSYKYHDIVEGLSNIKVPSVPDFGYQSYTLTAEDLRNRKKNRKVIQQSFNGATSVKINSGSYNFTTSEQADFTVLNPMQGLS
jgi:hypothetical protein